VSLPAIDPKTPLRKKGGTGYENRFGQEKQNLSYMESSKHVYILHSHLDANNSLYMGLSKK
jgi:hypothetical protein